MIQIRNYTVEEEPIGIGGMGRILRGRDSQGRDVAIKEISPDFANDFQIRYHIEKEVEILQKMNHTSIVRIYEDFYDEESGKFYIVMELVEGKNIEQYIAVNGTFSEDRAKSLMLNILDVMNYVHNQGIIHRDIKPSNIMIRNNGEICLLDFGVAKDTTMASGTIIGSIIGTDGYMSPEQADGYSIDKRADIYALGCVLFYMLTGHHAFNTLGSEFETKNAIINKEFPRLSKYRKDITARTQAVLDRATDKNMRTRYQTCLEFAKALGPGTQISKRIDAYEPISVTVGREMCDIIVKDSGQKISRQHATIELKQFTGGKFYIFTDKSANGTYLNGKKINNESTQIPYNKVPEIYLACVPEGKLDWSEVVRILDEKVRETTQTPIAPDPNSNITVHGYESLQKKTSVWDNKFIILAIVSGIIISSLLTVIITLLVIMN